MPGWWSRARLCPTLTGVSSLLAVLGQVVFVLGGIQGKPDLNSVPQGKAGAAKKRHSCVEVLRDF